VALLEQKAELTMAFYDSIEAVKDEYEQRLAAVDRQFAAIEENGKWRSWSRKPN